MFINYAQWIKLSDDKKYDKKFYIIHSKEVLFPLVYQFKLELNQKFSINTQKYSFEVDKAFKYQDLCYLNHEASLFEAENYITLDYKINGTSEHLKSLNEVYNQTALSANNTYVVCMSEINKRDISSNLWMQNPDVYVISLGDADLHAFITNTLAKNNIKIEHDAINLLIELNLNNYPQLIQTLNKAIATLINGGIITNESVKGLVNDNAVYNVFNLSNAYLAGNIDLTYKIFNSLYMTTEDMILIIWMLSEDVRKLLKYKALLKDRITNDQALKEVKVWGETVNKFNMANKRLSYSRLIDIYYNIARLDLIVKGVLKGSIADHMVDILKQMCI